MNQYKSIFISDVHLGTSSCKAEALCKFLKTYNSDNLFLIGDIIDGWRLQRGWNWPQSHSNVIRKILTKAKRGTKIVYLSGNHDEFLRKWTDYDLKIGNIHIVDNYTYMSTSGYKFLLTHGDLFDAVTRNWKLVSIVGSILYDILLIINGYYNEIRRIFGCGYWSLSKYIKHNAKQAANFIFSFEDHLADHALTENYDGVICGHIHYPEIKKIPVWAKTLGNRCIRRSFPRNALRSILIFFFRQYSIKSKMLKK